LFPFRLAARSVVWTGFVKPAFAEAYTFNLVVDVSRSSPLSRFLGSVSQSCACLRSAFMVPLAAL
jgi:hypothetical protein